MILRISSPSRIALSSTAPEPAFEIFLRSQKDVPNPLPILQSAHSHLAGELAARLQPDVFGALPDSVIEAIRLHDYGWIRSDMQQLENRAEPVRSFLTIASSESTAIWGDSIRLAESVSSLAGVLVSRHFCTIAQSLSDPEHLAFDEREMARRLKLEKGLSCGAAELERWTSALGFCDLLSLYLCSGAVDPAVLALCHPFDGVSCNRAPKVIVQSNERRCRTEPRIFPTGTQVEQYVMAPLDGASGHRPTTLNWTFE